MKKITFGVNTNYNQIGPALGTTGGPVDTS